MNRSSEGAQSAARILNLHRVDTMQLANGAAYMVGGDDRQYIDYAGPEPEDERGDSLDSPWTFTDAALTFVVGLIVLVVIGGLVGYLSPQINEFLRGVWA